MSASRKVVERRCLKLIFSDCSTFHLLLNISNAFQKMFRIVGGRPRNLWEEGEGARILPGLACSPSKPSPRFTSISGDETEWTRPNGLDRSASWYLILIQRSYVVFWSFDEKTIGRCSAYSAYSKTRQISIHHFILYSEFHEDNLNHQEAKSEWICRICRIVMYWTLTVFENAEYSEYAEYAD